MISQRVRSLLLTGLLLALGVSACLPTPNASPSATPNASTETPNALGAATATAKPTSTPILATVLQPVWVRDQPSGIRKAGLAEGASVKVLYCKDNWCEIERPFGFVWIGCLSRNPDKIGCEAK
jgi:hypothetical protein